MEQTSASSTLRGVARLRGVLDTIGDSLSSGAFDKLVAAEANLAAVLSDPNLSRQPVDVDPQLEREIRAVRASLDRARYLGAGLAEIVHVSLRVQGREPEYGPDGASPVPVDSGSLDRSV